MTKDQILKRCEEENVRYVRLQFTDMMGVNKNVELPVDELPKALDGEIMFDGSSIEGFARIEESDMILSPDFDTFVIFPWIEENSQGKIARIICDIKLPDGSDFDGCPRTILKKVCKEAEEMGYELFAGPEAEFFLFELDDHGNITTKTHDKAGYFDLAPIDKGEIARRAIVQVLESIGFDVEAAHHEVAHGQHEIDFRYENAIKTADNIATFRFVVRKVASQFGLHATFMPKPVFGINGSGMHTHMSLFRNGDNVFYDEKAEYQLSEEALYFIGGLLEHAKAFVAITNPLVNSYKRLVPGYEAPVNIAWSEKNRSPLIRVPAKRGNGTRVEVRVPDPSANPYLALAVMLKSGLDGIKRKITPPPPVNKNIYTMSVREKRRHKISELPPNLYEAVKNLEKDEVLVEALGKHISEQYVKAKLSEWQEYISQVHQWELDNYLGYY
ncbi:MAG: type I glutamate--ammonia ligase [Calditrichia bacterium]